MASLSDITVKPELRPCIVNGKIKALFHRWQEETDVIAPSVLRGGHSGGEIKILYGIIEDETGQVAKVNPTVIKFTDDKIQEYYYPPESSNSEEVESNG